LIYLFTLLLSLILLLSIFSILLKKNGAYHLTAPLALCLALAGFGYDTGIKWPNDIYLQNKKLA
jgi:biotin-(acetyl-CoA carboxylase) ligase